MTAPTRRRPRLPDPEAQPTMTAAEVGVILGRSPRRVYELAAAGELPAVRLGGRVLVLTAALRRQLGVDPPADRGEGAADAVAT
jgi:excisionase family DNA binding protein